MSQILGNLSALTWQMAAMWAIGGVMIYLAICKEMEPTLLLPMGFGCILCNLPNSGAVEVLETLFQAGVANELFPLLLFIGIGAMIDFGPLLADPKLLLFGAAGISAFPMSSRVIAKMAKEEDPYNFILMQAAGANVAGQVASVIAGGIILALVGPLV